METPGISFRFFPFCRPLAFLPSPLSSFSCLSFLAGPLLYCLLLFFGFICLITFQRFPPFLFSLRSVICFPFPFSVLLSLPHSSLSFYSLYLFPFLSVLSLSLICFHFCYCSSFYFTLRHIASDIFLLSWIGPWCPFLTEHRRTCAPASLKTNRCKWCSSLAMT
jgi:hypothetical protein